MSSDDITTDEDVAENFVALDPGLNYYAGQLICASSITQVVTAYGYTISRKIGPFFLETPVWSMFGFGESRIVRLWEGEVFLIATSTNFEVLERFFIREVAKVCLKLKGSRKSVFLHKLEIWLESVRLHMEYAELILGWEGCEDVYQSKLQRALEELKRDKGSLIAFDLELEDENSVDSDLYCRSCGRIAMTPCYRVGDALHCGHCMDATDYFRRLKRDDDNLDLVAMMKLHNIRVRCPFEHCEYACPKMEMEGKNREMKAISVS